MLVWSHKFEVSITHSWAINREGKRVVHKEQKLKSTLKNFGHKLPICLLSVRNKSRKEEWQQ